MSFFSWQALRIPFQLVSASELEDSYRELIVMNYGKNISHLYKTLGDQVDCCTVCTLCEGTLNGRLFGACQPVSDLPPGEDLDILFSGSPCNPFSVQRAKRFCEGSVKQHSSFQTMEEVCHLYKVFEPKKGVLEQVLGFGLPFEKGGAETPKDQFLSRDCVFNFFFAWYITTPL